MDEQAIHIPVENVTLEGDFVRPEGATAIVVFAHGSGSSRFSPRNRLVAGVLQQSGLATLLMDLLTEQEERVDAVSGELRFDIELLAKRLTGAADWLRASDVTGRLAIGYFGSSTG